MPTTRSIHFTAEIAAPVSRVFEIMLDPEQYRAWTKPFDPGSRYEGTWKQGERIRFLSSTGSGMLSEVVEHRPNEFTSLRHLGFVHDGVEDTTSDAVREWAGAIESYTFHATPAGTRVVVDMNVADDWESHLSDMWPRALARLKEICEAGAKS